MRWHGKGRIGPMVEGPLAVELRAVDICGTVVAVDNNGEDVDVVIEDDEDVVE